VEEECKSFFFEPKTGAVPAPHHDTDSIWSSLREVMSGFSTPESDASL
jgi:hypothetical protein